MGKEVVRALRPAVVCEVGGRGNDEPTVGERDDRRRAFDETGNGCVHDGFDPEPDAGCAEPLPKFAARSMKSDTVTWPS